MEIKINKEIKDYHESMFFGLSARQFICSVLAAPFAAAGFFKYNGMTFEKFAAAYIRSEFLASGRRVFKSENILYNLYREGVNSAVKKNKKSKKA